MLLTLASMAMATHDHPYCNTAMNTGIIPSFAGTKLIQVHVLHRHGSRTKASVGKVPCWAGEEDTQYMCTAAPLEAPDFRRPNGAVMFKKVYARGRNSLHGNCALGQLVTSGLEMCSASGRHLRQAYGSLLPLSLSGHESDVFLRSDDSPRTLASGQALFESMWNHSDSTLVPWHTMDAAGEETMLPSTTVCPALEAALARLQTAVQRSAHYRTVTVPLASALSSALNRSITPGGIGSLLDCLMSVQCPTVPSTGGQPPASFTAQLQQATIDETTHALYTQCNDSDVARFGAGPLLGEVLVAMEAAAAGKPGTPKYVQLSGHDTGPMAPILGALRIGGAEFPRFNDLLAIELHMLTQARSSREDSHGHVTSHAVRLVHNGEVVSHLVEGCPSDSDLCPFAAFQATVADLVPTAAQCGREDSPSWWPHPVAPKLRRETRPTRASVLETA